MGSIVYRADLQARLYAHICTFQTTASAQRAKSDATHTAALFTHSDLPPQTAVNNASIA